jgi:pimeloyl-ACP methyl ester carboxylesterase
VPENRADPQSPTIRLAVAIFHPDGPAEPDPILYLEGGPGGSPLEFLELTFEIVYEPMLAANRDIVILDQRGVGFSEPALDCPETNALDLELMDNELDGQELSIAEITDRVIASILACEAELLEIADLSAYNSVASAADVNDLRLALGYDQVNLWGTSYGTRLALGVMRDFPEGVRSVVLDSVYPPDVDLYLGAPANFDRVLTLLFENCRADETCDAAYPNLEQVLFDTVERLNANPADLEVTNLLTLDSYPLQLDGDSLIGLLFQFFYQTDVLPSLPQIIYDASEDDFQLLLLLFGSLLAQAEASSPGMHFSVQCNEEIVFSSLEEFEAALAEYPDLAGLFEHSSVGSMGYEVCASWDSGEASARENQAVESDIPTLVLTGQYDPITPPAWGRRAADTLSRSHFYEFPGVGHGASLAGDCPLEIMLTFLDDPDSAPDAACIAEMPGLEFAPPGGSVGDIELVPYTEAFMGIRGVVPAGWEEVSPGVLSRGNSALDFTLLILAAAPMPPEDFLAGITEPLGFDEPLQAVAEREANGLTWQLYEIEVQGLLVDIAVAEDGAFTLAVLLQSGAGERDALYDAVYLPAVEALVREE